MNNIIDLNANNIYEELYDVITFTGGAAIAANTPYPMFTVPVDGVNKFMWQTNNPKAGVCPYEFMNIMYIGFRIFMNTIGGTFPSLSDVNKITKNMSLSIYKNTTPILQVPVSRIGGGNQIVGNVSNTNNSLVAVVTEGIGHVDSMLKIGANAQGDDIQQGIPFVKDENMKIILQAENTFTPAVTCYARLTLFSDVYIKVQ